MAPSSDLLSTNPVGNPYVRQLLTGRAITLGQAGATDPMDRPWTTAIFKSPVHEPTWLSRNGLDQDQVGDTIHHGGPEKAVFAYPVIHYEYWRAQPGLSSMTVGGMGENLAVDGADESTVCLGDTYAFGQAIIEVSQPRQPCWKPARRFRTKDLALQIQHTGKTGWYFRVLKEGLVEPQTPLVLQSRPYAQWTIDACNRVMHGKKDDPAQIAELSTCTPLGQSWKTTLQKRLEGTNSSITPRVWGPNEDLV